MEQKILYTIEIDGNEVLLESLGRLRQETSDLQKENVNYNKSLRDGKPLNADVVKTYESNILQIKENKKQMNELTKEIQNQNNANKTLQAQYRDLKKELQLMAAAGKDNTVEYGKLRDKAAALKEAMDGVNDELKTLSDGERTFTTLNQGAQVMNDSFGLVTGTMAIMGFESEKFEEVTQKLVATMAISNSLQSLANNLKKESAVRIAISSAATKVATGVQWLWNAAMTANPIGLIIAGIVALGAAITGLIVYYDKIIETAKRWLGIGEDEQKVMEKTIDVHKKYQTEINNTNRLSKERQDSIQFEIDLMKAQGKSIDEIAVKERELLTEKINNAKQTIALQIQEAEVYMKKYAVIAKMAGINEETIKSYYEEVAGLKELENQLIIFDANETKRKSDREKEQRNTNKELYQQELENLAKLEVAKNKSYTSELELLKVQTKNLLDNDKLTETERLLITQDFLNQKTELEAQYQLTGNEMKALNNQTEIDMTRAKYLTLDEDEKLFYENQKLNFESNSLTRMELINRDYQTELDALDNLYANKMIKDEEYATFKKQLDNDYNLVKIDLIKSEVDAVLNAGNQMVDSLVKAGMSEEKATKYKQKIAIAQTTANIVAGIAQSAAIGFPQNIPMILGFIGQTATLIGQIRSINVPPAPKLAKGGIIGGQPHSLGGTTFVGSDGSRFEAEKDEYLAVVNKYDSKRAAMLDNVNSVNGKSFGLSGLNYFADGGIYTPRQTFNSDYNDLVRNIVESITQIPVVVSERDITSTQSTVRKIIVRGDL